MACHGHIMDEKKQEEESSATLSGFLVSTFNHWVIPSLNAEQHLFFIMFLVFFELKVTWLAA